MCAGGGVSVRNAYSRVLGEFLYEISHNSTLLCINQTQTFDHLHIDKPKKPIERLNAANMDMQQITEPHQIFFHISNIYSPKPLKLSPHVTIIGVHEGLRALYMLLSSSFIIYSKTDIKCVLYEITFLFSFLFYFYFYMPYEINDKLSF